MALTPGSYPTEGAVAQILAAEKRISRVILWEYAANTRRRWAIFSTEVRNAEGWELRLYGRAQLVDTCKRSYSLIWTLDGVGHRIFALDVNGNHINHSINAEQWRRRTHKQIWKDAYPGFAYTPDEVIPEEPNAAFLEFCRECNIVFTGQLGVFPPT